MSVRPTRFLVVLVSALLCARDAVAGERIALPAGEDPLAWQVPFSLAGLEPSAAGNTRIRIEVSATGWVLRATGADGMVRTAKVTAPRTAEEREEVAFLAKSLLSSVDSADPLAPAQPKPAPLLPPPLLPPPPKPLPPPPKLLPPKPKPEPLASLPEALAPLEKGPARFDPLMRASLSRVSLPDNYELSFALERPPKRPIASVPPVWASTGVVWRPATDPGARIALGGDVARLDVATFGWHTAFVFAHDLRFGLPRVLQSFEWEIDMMFFSYRSPVKVSANAGPSFRWYRQQLLPITNGVMPVFGIDTWINPISQKTWAIELRLGAKVDLATTTLYLPDGQLRNLAPVELGADISFRWWGRGDPFFDQSTSNQ